MIELIDFTAKAQFAGHETFPLRLLWLKKAFEAVKHGAIKGTFQEQSAIADFGVGRNMVYSIRHWALAAGVIEECDDGYSTTPLGRWLLDDETGADPYLEDPASAWVIHYVFAGTPELTTSFYLAFNGLMQSTFDRAGLASSLLELSEGRKLWRASASTFKRDVEVFVRSYVSRGAGEDGAEPLLAELGLMHEGKNGQLEFIRGPKATLPDGVFAWALQRFWQRFHKEASSLSKEQICYGAGSPGRVFKLDEDSVHTRLARIAIVTDGMMTWTDTAGLGQVNFRGLSDEEVLIRSAFMPRLKGAA